MIPFENTRKKINEIILNLFFHTLFFIKKEMDKKIRIRLNGLMKKPRIFESMKNMYLLFL